ncbi:hypothetical protein C3730_25485, partial [Salmonella enterica]
DEQRLDFWPLYFGDIPQWISLEPRIFAWMDRFCPLFPIRQPSLLAFLLTENIHDDTNAMRIDVR